MSNVENAVGARLEADRRDLLDLSLRNPLLNYRPRAGAGVRGRVARAGLSGPGPRGEAAVLPPRARTDAIEPPPRRRRCPWRDQTDLKLQTGLAAEPLQARLLAIYYAARTSIEEQGVNTLFLALGMLRWSEADDRERRAAPRAAVLVPVELERSSARERFRLRAHRRGPRGQPLARREAPGRLRDRPARAPRRRRARTSTPLPRRRRRGRPRPGRAGRSTARRSCSGSSRSASS